MSSAVTSAPLGDQINWERDVSFVEPYRLEDRNRIGRVIGKRRVEPVERRRVAPGRVAFGETGVPIALCIYVGRCTVMEPPHG